MSVLDKFASLYSNLNKESVSELAQVYHKDATLEDPVGTHSGLNDLSNYFDNLLESCRYCAFDIEQTLQQGENCSVKWIMHYEHPKLKGGARLQLEGSSVLKIQDDLIIWQKDYYDMGAMLYEHIPLLGKVISMLKARLRGN